MPIRKQKTAGRRQKTTNAAFTTKTRRMAELLVAVELIEENLFVILRVFVSSW